MKKLLKILFLLGLITTPEIIAADAPSSIIGGAALVAAMGCGLKSLQCCGKQVYASLTNIVYPSNIIKEHFTNSINSQYENANKTYAYAVLTMALVGIAMLMANNK